MTPEDLHTLPPEHPARNTKLVGCHYRWTEGKDWREVLPSFGIAKSTYNDLGPSWTDFSVFCWQPPQLLKR